MHLVCAFVSWRNLSQALAQEWTKCHRSQVSASDLEFSYLFFISREKIHFDVGVFLNRVPICRGLATIEILKPEGGVITHGN